MEYQSEIQERDTSMREMQHMYIQKANSVKRNPITHLFDDSGVETHEMRLQLFWCRVHERRGLRR